MDSVSSRRLEICPSSRRPIGFLDLPFELRHNIYCQCLVRKDSIKLHKLFICNWRFRKSCNTDARKGLLLGSKQVGCEALDVLYGDNVFQKVLDRSGGGAGHCILKYLSEANRQRIRNVQIVLQPDGYGYSRMLDSALWSPILAGLKKLSIVALQPLQANRYRWPCSLEKDMQEWMEWVRIVLQYIAPQLSISCIIEVDEIDRKKTSALMKEYFPTGYREVHTLEGDLHREEMRDPANSILTW